MLSRTPGAPDHAEAVALFRHSVIGSLIGRDFDHGELRAELERLSRQYWRPPGSDVRRRYGLSTIERWYYAYQAEGLAGLFPSPRSDRGRGRALTDTQRKLLLDVRREHPHASTPLILRTLVAQGVLDKGQVSAATVNRLYADHDLRRQPRKSAPGQPRQRLRWQAEKPGALWHADVCHGPNLKRGDRTQPVRIHALLDDHSRYVVALEVFGREREVEMLEMLGRALIRHGRPAALYLDNGATYVGKGLQTVCSRLKVGLQHARPYDPQARGKMERFWRTMREQCLDYISPDASLHDVRVRLHAWLDQHYHRSPHAGLMGKTPEKTWGGSDNVALTPVTDEAMKEAFAVRTGRRLRADSTVDVGGRTYEVDAGFIGRRNVTVVQWRPPLDTEHPPVLEHAGRTFDLVPVDPIANADRRRRSATKAEDAPSTDFDPAQTQLDRATGRLSHTPKSSS